MIKIKTLDSQRPKYLVITVPERPSVKFQRTQLNLTLQQCYKQCKNTKQIKYKMDTNYHCTLL